MKPRKPSNLRSTSEAPAPSLSTRGLCTGSPAMTMVMDDDDDDDDSFHVVESYQDDYDDDDADDL